MLVLREHGKMARTPLGAFFNSPIKEETVDELVRIHAIVTGRVQGVGFRAFTRHHAIQRELQGWVRNRPDGTVELEAEGPRDVLEVFLNVLREGPQFSQVSKISVDWKDANRQTQGFVILRD